MGVYSLQGSLPTKSDAGKGKNSSQGRGSRAAKAEVCGWGAKAVVSFNRRTTQQKSGARRRVVKMLKLFCGFTSSQAKMTHMNWPVSSYQTLWQI